MDLTLALDGSARLMQACEVCLGLHEAITGPEERQKLFREFTSRKLPQHALEPDGQCLASDPK